jgi:four helix bundle protein
LTAIEPAGGRPNAQSVAAADAVLPILQRPALRKDFELADQLSRSSSRVAPLVAEGWGQLTDRHVATYLGRARGSAYETRVHLQQAFKKHHISEHEWVSLGAQYEEICKMLTPLINYLERSNWKTRIRRD